MEIIAMFGRRHIARNLAIGALLAAPAALGAQHEGHGTTSRPAANRPAGGNAPERDSSAVAHTDAAMSGAAAGFAARHMDMTAARPATARDSARAARIVRALRVATAKYRDVSVAVKDGYRMFAPNVKEQRVYHFTNYRSAIASSFGFDPAKPTSLLYRKGEDGALVLIGAMYTAPKRATEAQLDARVPLGIARWHRHVNICVPPMRERQRWREVHDGAPVFGPLSPIATKPACDAVGGRFLPQIFGWMVHANVYAGDDPKQIWGDEHGGAHGKHDH